MFIVAAQYVSKEGKENLIWRVFFKTGFYFPTGVNYSERIAHICNTCVLLE